MVPHRLDYATSGVLVAPLTPGACRAADAALRARDATKFYLAILRGHVDVGGGGAGAGAGGALLTVDRPVGEDDSPGWKGVRMSCGGRCRNPRPAVTRMAVVSRGLCGGYPATKVCMAGVVHIQHCVFPH